MTERLNVEQSRLAAASLAALVAAIDAGEIEASIAERAYLAGARDALAAQRGGKP